MVFGHKGASLLVIQTWKAPRDSSASQTAGERLASQQETVGVIGRRIFR